MPPINLNNTGTQQDFIIAGSVPFDITFTRSSGTFSGTAKAYLVLEWICETPFYPERPTDGQGSYDPRRRAFGVKYEGDTDDKTFQTNIPNTFTIDSTSIKFNLSTAEVNSFFKFNTANYELIIIDPSGASCKKYRPLYGTFSRQGIYTKAGTLIGSSCK